MICSNSNKDLKKSNNASRKKFLFTYDDEKKNIYLYLSWYCVLLM